MKTLVLLISCLAWAWPALALTLDQDSRWSGELVFAEKVVVPDDVTLTVLPGTRVQFTAGGLEIKGRLVVDQATFSGTGWDGLSLKNCDASTRLSQVEIRGAQTGLHIQGGSPDLAALTLRENETGIELRGMAAGSLRDSHFLQNRKVGLFIKDESTTAVTGCRFAGNGRFGAYIYRSLPARFSDNEFVDNPTGLMIAYHGTNPDIAANRFFKNLRGIQVDRAARPVVRDNLLQDNRTAIYLYRRSDPQLVGNRLVGNGIGVLVAYSSYPQIRENDFVANELALKLEYQSARWEETKGAAAREGEVASRSAFAGQGMRTVTEAERRADSRDGIITATDNWWGDDGTLELAQLGSDGNPSFIHDGRDQATFTEGGAEYPLDRVRFAPWSTQPHREPRP